MIMNENLQVIRVDPGNNEQLEMAFLVRRTVFVGEQGVDPALEYDEHEQNARHYLVLAGATPAGAARWRETSRGIKLERFAVIKEFRNNGIGKRLVEEVLRDVIPEGKKIYLHSQVKAVPLYERAGFRKSGKIFYEADIAHYYMEFHG
jgi:predicted GNAT family N-acyltransferase